MIISEDQTRPTPVHQILEPLWAELNRLGIADDQIDVIVGRGTHREATPDEVRAKVGDKAVDKLRVSVHDPDADDLVHIGTTSRGTEVWVNPLVAEAALIIGIGTSNPHYFAGYGGGAKMILPGVCGRSTIAQNHAWIHDPGTVVGVMEGNPIWEDMLEAARLARLTFKFDTVVNAAKEIHALFGGEVEAQQKAADRGAQRGLWRGRPRPGRRDDRLQLPARDQPRPVGQGHRLGRRGHQAGRHHRPGLGLRGRPRPADL